MKHIATIILLSMAMLSLSACHQEENDLFATAVITLDTDAEVSISKVQAQAQITNVNTRQKTTTADFDGTTLHIELLRGAYEVMIEGVATCNYADGTTRMRQFRAQTDYVELAGKETNATKLNIIFLD